jgi:membrane protease subunit HflK
MPWSNQTGNGGGYKGGGGNGNGGGPWGQGPRPGNSGKSPDLEEILRRGQDRLRRAIPGGGGGRGGPQGGAGNGFAFGGLILIVLAVIWAFNAVHMVQPGEYGVKIFLGKPRQELASEGLNFTAWPLETFQTVPAVENQLKIGSAGDNGSGALAGQMLSGDQNIVNVQFSILYRIDNPQSYLFNVDDPQGMLRQVAESAMREVVGSGVSIEDAAPPQQVATAFEEVQRAGQDQTRFVEEANLYRNQQLGEARGQAVQIREDAAAERNRLIQEAQGESQRFTSILDEYEKSPEITRKRMFIETMEGVYRDAKKVIIESGTGGQGVVPYLPLNDLQKRTGTTIAPNVPNQNYGSTSTGATASQGAN